MTQVKLIEMPTSKHCFKLFCHSTHYAMEKAFNSFGANFMMLLGNGYEKFLPERDYVTFGSLLCQIRLSVTFVRPT